MVKWMYASTRIRAISQDTAPQMQLALDYSADSLLVKARKAGPTLRSSIQLLSQCKLQGGSAAAVLESVFAARTASARAHPTHQAHASHLGCDWVGVQRYGVGSNPYSFCHRPARSGIVDDASTLRDLFAA